MFVTRYLTTSLQRKLGALLALMLVLLAVVVAGTFLLVQQQEAEAREVNVAGRQRMLSQKMTKHALLLARGDESQRAGLQGSSALFARSLQGLIHGDAEMGLPGATEQVRPALDVVAAE